MNYTVQLAKEGHLLTRSQPKGKAPRRRIPRVTKKRARANREYSERRKAFLEKWPLCQARDAISAFLENDCRFEELWGLQNSTFNSEEIHHMKKPKCKYLNDESTWLAVSRWAHRWIEDHKRDARALGLLL